MIKVLLGIVLTLCVVNYGIDFLFYLKNRYCRFHIGRWDEQSWRTAVERTACRWVKYTPTVKITDNSRYMLFDLIQGKYRSGAIQSWQKAALILGLLESGNERSRAAARQAARALLDEDGMWKRKPTAVDCGMLSFAVLKAAENPQAVRPAMEYSAALIRQNVNDHGMISYTGGRENPEMYVDTLGLTCPFLALYARVYHDSPCEALAIDQLRMYHTYGLLPGTALPNHAFHIKSKLPLGVYGWGRGTAWYLIGLLDTYRQLRTPEYQKEALQWIAEAASSYAAYQHADGGFGSILQRESSYDSSATATMAWFYAECAVLLKNSAYWDISRRCLLVLRKKTRITGAIDDCQGDTKGIGIFAQTYDIMPFAQGMALRAIDVVDKSSEEEKR